MGERLTVQSLHESLRNDPMALVMGPAVQAGLYLAAVLDRDHPTFWWAMRDELLAQGAEVEGMDEANSAVVDDLLANFERLKGAENGDDRRKRVRKADRKVGA